MKTTTKTKTAGIDFGADYPERESMFALHVIKLLSVPLVARELGSQGCNLVRVVATLEDNQFYAGGVLATDEDLRPMLAVTEKTLVTARRRCVEAGWLHYEPSGVRGVPSRMWVKVPTYIEMKTRHPIQWKNSTRSETTEPIQGNFSTTTGTTSGTTSGTTTGTTTDPSYIPNPIPETSPASPTKAETWETVENEMLELGIGDASTPLRSCQVHRVPIGLVLGILRYASEAKLWSPGLIRRRLLNLRPGQSVEDRRLWMKPDQVANHQANQPASAESLKRRDDRLRQLEFEFESELKELTTATIVDRYSLPDQVRERLRPYPTWKHTTRDPVLRLAVLETIAEMKGR